MSRVTSDPLFRVCSSFTNSLITAMATPIRKKRNFKALQLATAPPVSPVSPTVQADPAAQPIPTRQAPPASGKKRPPPMTLKAPKLPPSTTSATTDDGNNLLTVQTSSTSAPNTASLSTNKRNTYHTALSNTLANLDLNAEAKLDLRNEDLKDLQELGQGNGGSVKKAEHIPTGMIIAKKVRIICLFSKIIAD